MEHVATSFFVECKLATQETRIWPQPYQNRNDAVLMMNTLLNEGKVGEDTIIAARVVTQTTRQRFFQWIERKKKAEPPQDPATVFHGMEAE